jgi:hypothetical protein
MLVYSGRAGSGNVVRSFFGPRGHSWFPWALVPIEKADFSEEALVKFGGAKPENEFRPLIVSEEDVITALAEEYNAKEGDRAQLFSLIRRSDGLLKEYCRVNTRFDILHESIERRNNYKDYEYLLTRLSLFRDKLQEKFELTEIMEKETQRIQEILIHTGTSGLKAGAAITAAAGGLKAVAAITAAGTTASAAGLSGTSLAASAATIGLLGADIACAGGALTIAGIVLHRWISGYKVDKILLKQPIKNATILATNLSQARRQAIKDGTLTTTELLRIQRKPRGGR